MAAAALTGLLLAATACGQRQAPTTASAPALNSTNGKGASTTPEHGFVFGNGLWETTDGGERWIRDLIPARSIMSLAIVQDQVLALSVPCTSAGGCQDGVLIRRPLSGGGTWIRVSSAGMREVSTSTFS